MKITVFDFTWADTRQAKRSACHSSAVGDRFVTTASDAAPGQGSRASSTRSRDCTSTAPRMARTSRLPAASSLPKSATMTRMFFFAARIARAASSTPGATTASMNVDAIAVAVSTSRARLSPTMPPNADSASASRARTYASAIDAPVAAPHGFVCLTTDAAGSVNSRTMRAAASRSSRLV